MAFLLGSRLMFKIVVIFFYRSVHYIQCSNLPKVDTNFGNIELGIELRDGLARVSCSFSNRNDLENEWKNLQKKIRCCEKSLCVQDFNDCYGNGISYTSKPTINQIDT